MTHDPAPFESMLWRWSLRAWTWFILAALAALIVAVVVQR